MGVFVTTGTLKARCRLSTAVDAEALAIFDESERSAAAWIVGELTPDIVQDIIAYPDDAIPTTAEGAIRLKAEQAETLYVFSNMLFRLPSFFLEAQSKSRMSYNDNAASRKQFAQLKDQSDRLTQHAVSLMAGLVADMATSDSDTTPDSEALLGAGGTRQSYPFSSLDRDVPWGSYSHSPLDIDDLGRLYS